MIFILPYHIFFVHFWRGEQMNNEHLNRFFILIPSHSVYYFLIVYYSVYALFCSNWSEYFRCPMEIFTAKYQAIKTQRKNFFVLHRVLQYLANSMHQELNKPFNCFAIFRKFSPAFDSVLLCSQVFASFHLSVEAINFDS